MSNDDFVIANVFLLLQSGQSIFVGGHVVAVVATFKCGPIMSKKEKLLAFLELGIRKLSFV